MANIKIDIAKNGLTTLATAGKYCDRNIDVEVNVAGGGGGESDIPETAFIITDICSYRFAYNGWNWFIEQAGDKIETNSITNVDYMFSNSTKLEIIPFEINMDDTTYRDMRGMFTGCNGLKELSKINNAYPSGINSLFYGCNNLRTIPEDFCDNWNFDRLHTYTSANMSSVFRECHSLRKIPQCLLDNMWGIQTSYTSSPYYNMLYNCYNLDEINGLAIQPGNLTSNHFSSSFSYCMRLKDLIFQTNEDGTPKTAKWKNQTIILDVTGYCSYGNSYIIGYNSGITADKEVKDDATYQALKDDPDWFSCDINYSRYNHDSAVNTINSLPDCSATGTNTIKFKGAAGALTDGGAINTLTEEEIAVAAAKGWTVSLV